MGKFGALFDDSDDDGAPEPVVVPRPPVGDQLDKAKLQEEQERLRQEQAQEQALAASDVPQQQQQVVADAPAGSRFSVSTIGDVSVAQSVLATPQVLPSVPQPQQSVPEVSQQFNNSLPTFQQTQPASIPIQQTFAQTTPNILTGEVLPGQEQGVATPVAVQQQQQQHMMFQSFSSVPGSGTPQVVPQTEQPLQQQQLQQQQQQQQQQVVVPAAPTPMTIPVELQNQMTQIQTQLQELLRPPPPPEPFKDLPELPSFPTFSKPLLASELRDGIDQQSWEAEARNAEEEADKTELLEKERDSQVVGKLHSEQITQLRKEKDSLREKIDDVQLQLDQRETDLADLITKGTSEMQTFKQSFNEIIQTQQTELDQVRSELKDEQNRVDSLQQLLSSKSDLASNRLKCLQEADIEVNSLRVEKGELETKTRIANQQLDSSRAEGVQLTSKVLLLEKEKAILGDQLDEVTAAKYSYIATLRTQHDSYTTGLRKHYDERENYFIKQYTSRESNLRDELTKFAADLRVNSEDTQARLKAHWEGALKEQTEQSNKSAKSTKRKHKEALADKDQAMETLKKKHQKNEDAAKKKLDDTEDKFRSTIDELKQKHEKENDTWRGKLDNEVANSDKKVKTVRQELQQEMLTKATAAKQELVKGISQAQLEGKAKLAELETQHRLREAQLEKKSGDSKDQLMELFKRELQKIGDEHRSAERELERMHRERESEFEKRIRLLSSRTENRANEVAATEDSVKLKEDFLGKWESQRQSLRDRHDTVKKSFT